VIERVFVVVLLGISILFMLVVLISLLRESLNVNGRIEGLRPAHLTNSGRPMRSILASHSKRKLEGVFTGAFSTTGRQRASSVIARKRRIKERLSGQKVNSSPIRSFFEKP
jgi:hypothetical protein